MEDKYIVMKVSDLRRLLNDVKRYEHYYIYASDQNRDGQGEWHCDIEVGNEPLGEDGWGDGDEHWSFDSLENHMAKFGSRETEVHEALFEMTRASLSSSSSRPAPQPPREEGLHLQEHLELCENMFDDFCREAQQFIDKAKEKGYEQN